MSFKYSILFQNCYLWSKNFISSLCGTILLPTSAVFIIAEYTLSSLPSAASLIALSTTFSAGTRIFFLKVLPLSPAISKKSVSTGPGQTEVTVIFFSLSSQLSALEKLNTYALVAAYTLNLGCGQKAAELAETLITSGKYALEKDFSKIFGYGRKANSETIFAFNMEDTETSIKLGSEYFTYEYVNKGSGNYFPTKTIIDLFESQDKRLPVTIVTVGTDKCLGKYPGGQAYTDPIIVSRIGEVYLISAEAQGFPDGCERLNQTAGRHCRW